MPVIEPAIDPDAPAGETLRVRGLVQGVGFRPTVWRLARDCGLDGDVRNDGDGVRIRIWGEADQRQRFVTRLQAEVPPLARIDSIAREPLTDSPARTGFRIVPSEGGAVHTGVAPDAATCSDCLSEIFDPADRRLGYAFTNCTHCGPRLSIIAGVPYDRANTSMAAFSQCPACRAEYENPADRRFHAQPNACPDCGPRLWLETAEKPGAELAVEPLAETARRLREGEIVAIKGIGGFHLACDAGNAAAVARLRERKRRPHKALALMARDLEMAREICAVDAAAPDWLSRPAAPIVLLPIRTPTPLADGIAPGLAHYGVMLPYSPLHHLLLEKLERPIVLTSGNCAGEPQCIGNDEARRRLGTVADALLLHDREVLNRLDDSVLRPIAGRPALLRRARGYAPAPLPLPPGFEQAPPLLACGGELKNTFCLLADGQATLAQHLGDQEHPAAAAAWDQNLALYLDLYRHAPRAVAIDAHPDYLPSQRGRAWAATRDLPLIEVQHHHAHIAACLADNGVELDAPPVLGLALDGNGYGDDGTLWGGEWLLADYRGYRRLAALAAVAMPGGAQAIHEPWRMAWAHLSRAGDFGLLARRHADLPFFKHLEDKPLKTLQGMVRSDFNSPPTSSCGRLFDAVAALTGLCQRISYEGQAACELEAAVDAAALADGGGYPFALTGGAELRLDPQPMWTALLADLAAGTPVGIVAARFHAGLAQSLADVVRRLAAEHGDPWQGRVALSGGVFQNAVLSELLQARLEARGQRVLSHRHVPANDGGLSLGQAAVAAARSLLPNDQAIPYPCA